MANASRKFYIAAGACFALLLGLIGHSVYTHREQDPPAGYITLEQDGRWRQWDGKAWIWHVGEVVGKDGVAAEFSGGRWVIKGHNHLEPFRSLTCPACQ